MVKMSIETSRDNSTKVTTGDAVFAVSLNETGCNIAIVGDAKNGIGSEVVVKSLASLVSNTFETMSKNKQHEENLQMMFAMEMKKAAERRAYEALVGNERVMGDMASVLMEILREAGI